MTERNVMMAAKLSAMSDGERAATLAAMPLGTSVAGALSAMPPEQREEVLGAMTPEVRAAALEGMIKNV